MKWALLKVRKLRLREKHVPKEAQPGMTLGCEPGLSDLRPLVLQHEVPCMTPFHSINQIRHLSE